MVVTVVFGRYCMYLEKYFDLNFEISVSNGRCLHTSMTPYKYAAEASYNVATTTPAVL